jgi:hypothetical protein
LAEEAIHALLLSIYRSQYNNIFWKYRALILN